MWRDIKKTSVVFASVIVLLLSLSLFSIVSVAAYFGLVVLSITTSYRLYTAVMGMINKSNDPQSTPFQFVYHLQRFEYQYMFATLFTVLSFCRLSCQYLLLAVIMTVIC